MGDGRSGFLLADLLAGGEADAAGSVEREEILRRSAEWGDAKARWCVAVREWKKGNGGEARELLESVARIASERGARTDLGLMLLESDRIEDRERGFLLLRESAERGDPIAMYAVGLCLSRGRGTHPSLSAARGWMRKAALLHHASAAQWREAHDPVK